MLNKTQCKRIDVLSALQERGLNLSRKECVNFFNGEMPEKLKPLYAEWLRNQNNVFIPSCNIGNIDVSESELTTNVKGKKYSARESLFLKFHSK